VREIEKKRAQ
jgi:hypothetical protein